MTEPGLREVMAAVTAQGLGQAGRWHTHQLRMDSAVFGFEIGVPVVEGVAPSGERSLRVRCSRDRGPLGPVAGLVANSDLPG